MLESPRIISGFHAHLYYRHEAQRRLAEAMRDTLVARFGAVAGMARGAPGGPHPAPMFQVEFESPAFGTIVPYLMLHRSGLDVLVHPVTGDDRADHDEHALWLGERLPILFSAL